MFYHDMLYNIAKLSLPDIWNLYDVRKSHAKIMSLQPTSVRLQARINYHCYNWGEILGNNSMSCGVNLYLCVSIEILFLICTIVASVMINSFITLYHLVSYSRSYKDYRLRPIIFSYSGQLPFLQSVLYASRYLINILDW